MGWVVFRGLGEKHCKTKKPARRREEREGKAKNGGGLAGEGFEDGAGVLVAEGAGFGEEVAGFFGVFGGVFAGVDDVGELDAAVGVVEVAAFGECADGAQGAGGEGVVEEDFAEA